jgi:hypothetical protein
MLAAWTSKRFERKGNTEEFAEKRRVPWRGRATTASTALFFRSFAFRSEFFALRTQTPH